ATVLDVITRYCDGPDGGGLHLNKSKCHILWPHQSPVPTVVSEFAAERGFQLDVGCMSLLGSVVGNDRAKMIQFIAKSAIEDHSTFFDALRHPALRRQNALILLRHSGIPRFSYLTRVLPPDIVAAA